LHSHFLLPTGGTKYIYELVRRLATEMSISVVVEGASPLWQERYDKTEAKLVVIPGRTSTSLFYWLMFPFYVVRDVRKVRALAKDADILVSSFFPMPWIAQRVRRQHQAHVTLCFEPFPFFHDSEVIRHYSPAKRLLLAGLRRSYGWMDVQGIRHADRVMTLNETTAQHIAKVYKRTDTTLLLGGVDTTVFRPYPEAETADLRERFGSEPICVHSTDYSPIKRTDLAIRAFAAAHSSVPSARLVITSTREDRRAEARLRQQADALGIADRVTFAGFLPFEDLPRLYSMAVVVLQTGTSGGSGATTMSLPVKEAMACSTAVVRSDATSEDVVDGVSGFLVDPADSSATGQRLALLLGEPDRAREMGRAGRDRIVNEYSWEAVASRARAAIKS
jgi:phosphatidylinositol alpha-1,6-mannosyltransferase